MRRRGDQIMHGTVVDADTTSHLLVSVHGETVGAVAAASPGLPVPGDPVTLVRAGRRLLALPGYFYSAGIGAWIMFVASPFDEDVMEPEWSWDNGAQGAYAILASELVGDIPNPDEADPPYAIYNNPVFVSNVQPYLDAPWWTTYAPTYYGSTEPDPGPAGDYTLTDGQPIDYYYGPPSGSVSGKTFEEHQRTVVLNFYWTANVTAHTIDCPVPPWTLAGNYADSYGAGVFYTYKVDPNDPLPDWPDIAFTVTGEDPGTAYCQAAVIANANT